MCCVSAPFRASRGSCSHGFGSLLVKVAPLITTTDVSACSRHNVTVWEHWVLCTRHLSPPLRHPWFRPRYTGPAVGRPYCTCASTPAHHPRSIQAIPIFLGCLEVARLFSVGCSCMDRDPLHDDCAGGKPWRTGTTRRVKHREVWVRIRVRHP